MTGTKKKKVIAPATPPWLNDVIEKDWQQYLKAGKRLGRRARGWLVRWCKNFLGQNPELGWVRVEVEENEEHYNVYHAHVTSDVNPDQGEGEIEEAATDALWNWAAVIRYGVPAGSWVRVTREGKIYRDKRKKEPADGD